MKRSDALLKVISFVIVLAMAAYLTVYLVQRGSDSTQTALVVTATMSDSTAMSGLVVREEPVLQSSEEYIDVTVSDGEKVGVGQTVAVAYSSESALERATQLHVLSQEIEEVSSALDSAEDVALTGDQTVYDAIISLSYTIQTGDLADMESQESALASLIFRTESQDATEEYLNELEKEYYELEQTSAGDSKEITVGQAGTFTTLVDGYEGVSPAYIQTLTPSELRALISAERTVSSGAFGKLVVSYYWYYAAILQEEDAGSLETGDTVSLSFGRYYSGSLEAEVQYISQPENGECIALFSMNQGLTDMLAVRAVSAELVYQEYTGLRVPVKGLYRYYAGYLSDEDGQKLTEGESVTLTLGGVEYDAFVSEIGSAVAYGELADGVESGSEEDTRPRRWLVVFCWAWSGEEDAPDFSSGGGAVTLADGTETLAVTNYYDYDESTDRMCVFTMTGLQAERKKVSLIFAGEEYCLVSSEGTDALREGNEVIVQAAGLYNGKVF